MPSFRAEVAHQLSQPEATRRLKAFLENLQQRFREQVTHLDGQWEANTLRFSLVTYGLDISGTLTVDEHSARVEGRLPLAALAFKGKIEKSIAAELSRELTAPAASHE